MSGAWGKGPWGGGSWGGGPGGGAIALLSVLAVRENVLRLEYSAPVYFSGIRDPRDASRAANYAVAPVAGTSGMDGEPARPLMVAEVLLPGLADGIDPGDLGHFVDLALDRPMTPFPALYDVTAGSVWAADLSDQTPSTTVRTPAVYRRIEPPTLDAVRGVRDIANPQTLLAARASLPNPTDARSLGTISADDTGDYAFDSGEVSYRKRILRRLTTRKDAFAHLPGYGVGIPQQGKRLAQASVLSALAADAEAQIGLEPETAKVRVTPVVDRANPGLVRFRVLVQKRDGTTLALEAPFLIAA